MTLPCTENIPSKCTVLIIGGGPAGSSSATHLVKAGIDVVLLERSKFPRNQVGESLIPHFWKFADQLGVSEKIEQEGFIKKSGAITAWDNKIHQTDFSKYGYTRPGLQVERDIFDNLLLDHSKSQGAQVFNQVVVKDINLASVNPVIRYIDTRKEENREGTIQCRFVIDASGHSAMIANQLGTKNIISTELNFLSLWGYFKHSRYIGCDRKSHDASELNSVAPVTFVSSHKDGWLWHIILREKTSVGLIVHTDRLSGMNKQQRESYFKQTCAELPYVKDLLKNASFMENSLNYRPDYSYYTTQSCGENYYCIGDAAGFVDPVFSHGVQNSFYNAAVTCLAITESLKTPQKQARYAQLCENRMQQFYGFSRALSLGDFGCNGVNNQLVVSLMKALPPLELELILIASEMTNRSDNFKKIAQQAGVWDRISANLKDQSLGLVHSLY